MRVFLFLTVSLFLVSCASTEIIDSPKTAYVTPSGEAGPVPQVIWTSEKIAKNYDYLGQVKVRSWTYDGALERLKQAGQEMRADALTDLHYQQIGFLNTFQAFAIKYKNQ